MYLYPSFRISDSTKFHWLSSFLKGSKMLSLSAWAAITEYHRQGGLNNRHLFLTVLEAGKSKIKVLADSVSGEDLFLVCRWLPSCCTLTWHREGSGLFSFLWGHYSQPGDSTFMTSSKPNYLLNVPPPNTITLRMQCEDLGLQPMNFRGIETFSPSQMPIISKPLFLSTESFRNTHTHTLF